MLQRATEGRCSRYTAYEPDKADAISINAKPLCIASKLNNTRHNNPLSPFPSLVTRLTFQRFGKRDICSSTTCFSRFELLVGLLALVLGLVSSPFRAARYPHSVLQPYRLAATNSILYCQDSTSTSTNHHSCLSSRHVVEAHKECVTALATVSP